VLRYDVDGSVATMTLDRPDRLNALDTALVEAVLGRLEQTAQDRDVRVLVLTGAGRAFCAGGDLKATIAAVNGPCAGAGLSWACAADLRYAAPSAVFTTAFVHAGQSGDYGGTWTLPRIIGSGRARELFLLGDRIDAEEAARIGLVNAVVPQDELLGHVRAIADRIASSAPLAVAAIKGNLNDGERHDLAGLLDRESERFAVNAGTADAVEAARAYAEKRAPRFQGR
jgi:2-(1,2-epoxy-1,2-dihydrophenyl)acetyl-CoA isomerase